MESQTILKNGCPMPSATKIGPMWFQCFSSLPPRHTLHRKALSLPFKQGVFQIWHDLFHLPFAGASAASVDATYTTIQSHGDYPLVASGCFENAPAVAGGDAGIERRALPAAEALSEAAAVMAGTRRGAFHNLQVCR